MKVQNNHTYFVGNDPNRIEQNNGENKKTGANASYMMKQTDPMALKREQAKKKAMTKTSKRARAFFIFDDSPFLMGFRICPGTVVLYRICPTLQEKNHEQFARFSSSSFTSRQTVRISSRVIWVLQGRLRMREA